MQVSVVRTSLLSFSLMQCVFGCSPSGELAGSSAANSGFPVSEGSDFALSTVSLAKMIPAAHYSCESNSTEIHDSSKTNNVSETTLTAADSEPDCQPIPVEAYQTFCSGVIIGPRTVLTAAHCLPEQKSREEAELESRAMQKELKTAYPDIKTAPNLTVIPSELRYFVVFGTDPKNPRGAAEVARAYTWQFADLDSVADYYNERLNDIAVLNINSDIPPGFKAAPLPPKADAHVPYEEFRAAWIAGFGRQGDSWRTPATTQNRVQGVMNQNPVTIDQSSSSIHNGTFNLEKSTACQGDSGGPLYKVKDSKAQVPTIDYLLGITSWGADGFNCAGDSFYTDVRQYLDFIARPSQYSQPIVYPLPTFEVRVYWPMTSGITASQGQ